MLSSKIKVTHPPGGISSTLRNLKTSPLLIVSADPEENKMMGERVRKVVVRNWKIMPIQILATIGEKMGEKIGKTSLLLVGMQSSTFHGYQLFNDYVFFFTHHIFFQAKFCYFFLHGDINEGSQLASNTQSLDIDITGFTVTQRDGTQEVDITGLQSQQNDDEIQGISSFNLH